MYRQFKQLYISTKPECMKTVIKKNLAQKSVIKTKGDNYIH